MTGGARGLIVAGGTTHAMAGLLPLETSFAARRLHLGYWRARWRHDMPFAAAGDETLGHEYHHATLVAGPPTDLAHISDAAGAPLAPAGHRVGRVTGTFIHMVA